MKNAATTEVVNYDSRVRDYIALLKPRVISLVVFTGLVGLLVAPGTIHPFIGFVSVICLALGSGAAGAINMWYERNTDALMKRTMNRPLPAGRISPDDALEFGVIMCFASVLIMAVIVNYAAAFLLLFAIMFYVFVYTMWLKFRTPQNIVIGGLPGAMPPLIGWASVTGDISVVPVILTLITFIWTPPHFWALALYRSEDYKKAGIPMMPVVRGVTETKKLIVAYTLLLFATTLLPFALGHFGFIYLAGVTALGLKFLYMAFKLQKDNSENSKDYAFKTFKFSIVYLFMIFILVLVDHYAVW